MIKVGVIGGGIYGTNLLNAFTQFKDENLCELKALADYNKDVLQKQCNKYPVTGYEDYRKMFEKEDLDAVAIATPDFLHQEIAIEAAEAGLHIFLEKPMDVTVEGCQAIIDTVYKNKVFLEIDFHKRFDPPHAQLAKAVREGKLGQVEYGYAWMEDTIEVPTEWLKNWSAKSSPVWFLGIHLYDLMRWIIDSDPIKVYATGVKTKLPSLGFNTYDSVQAKVEFKNNISIIFDSSWVIPKAFPSIVNQGCRLIGTEGIWEIDSQNRGVETVLNADCRTMVPNFYFIRKEKDFTGKSKYFGYGIDCIRAFINHVNYLAKGGSIKELEGHYASGYDGLQATKIAMAVLKSVNTGKIVEIQ